MNKALPGARFVASYSGGKDSVLAIHRAIRCGMKLQALLITYNTDRGRSWFHGIPENVLEQVAQSIGVPIRFIRTNDLQYAENFEKALKLEQQNGAQACVFGDIDIEGHLEWCTARCESAGLKACFPLWKENRRMLTEECINSGFRPTVTVVDTRRLDASFAGKPLTLELIRQMEQVGIDPCGENGEYHSFVTDGPIFSKPIPVTFNPTEVMNGYALTPVVLKTDP